MSSKPDPNGPVILLSLDGGGVRGICSLLVLREIMNRVAIRERIPSETIKPADYFHLIGGTSTGGLISLMLGRFHMTTDECLKQYRSLSEQVFGPKNIKSPLINPLTAHGLKERGRYKATTLENIVKRLAKARLKDEDALMKVDGMEIGMGRCFVLSTAKSTADHARYLRTYSVPKFEDPNCLVWQAARATTAAPKLFKPITISRSGGSHTDYIDPAIGFNNPIKQVLSEAEGVFGGDRKVRCILSLGTGLQDPAGITGDGKIWILEVINMLKDIVTDCERAHRETHQLLHNHQGLYYRFNVDAGVQKIELNEWEKLSNLEEYTERYMENTPGVNKQIDEVVDLILGGNQGRDVLSLSAINSIQTISRASPVILLPRERKSSHYIEHVILSHEISKIFSSPGDGLVQTALVVGLGGSGKTQACLEFFGHSDTGFVHKFWINASNPICLAQSYSELADKAAIYDDTPGKNVKNVRKKVVEWLERQTDSWLLVLDDMYDDKHASLWYPHFGCGRVIITCRHELDVPQPIRIHFPVMTPENAIILLQKIVGAECGSREDEEALVTDLGFLPLAIELAGNHIGTEGFSIQNYRKVWASTFKKNKNTQDLEPEEQRLDATIRISYEHLRRKAEKSTRAHNALELLRLLSFFSPRGIPERIFIRARERWDKALTDADTPEPWKSNLPAVFSLESSTPGDAVVIMHNMRSALKILRDYSFLTFDGDNPPHEIDVNALIHRWIQVEEREAGPQRKPEESALWNVAASTLAMSISRESEATDSPFHRSLAPHLDNILQRGGSDLAVRDGSATGILAICLPMPRRYEAASRFARVFSLSGYFTKARGLRLAVYEALNAQTGRNPSELVHACSLLADACSDDGDKAAALKYRERALDLDKECGISERASEPHLRQLRDLADSYRDFHRYEEAHKLRERIRHIWKESKPNERAGIHADRDFATSFYDLGNYQRAMLILEKVVMIERNRVTQSRIDYEDGDLLLSLSELARCYSANGYEKKAKDAYQEVFDARGRKPHHDSFVAMQDLANSYSKLGNEAEAYELRKEIVAGFNELGDRISQKHPSFLAAQFNLARSHLTMGKDDDALRLHQEVLEYRKALNQPDEYDLETVDSMLGLALSYCRMSFSASCSRSGQDTELYKVLALEEGRYVARICGDKVASRNSPDIRKWFCRWNDVGKLQYELRQFDCAIDTHTSVLKALERESFEKDDDDVLSTVFLLAQNYFKRKDFPTAAKFLKDIIELLRKKLDVEEYGHPRLIDPHEWLARTLQQQGADALSMYEEILKMREMFHGKEAKYTRNAADTLVSQYRSRREPELTRKAEKLEVLYGMD